MSPGTMGGRVANASPLDFRSGAVMPLIGGGGGGYRPPPRRVAAYVTGLLAANEAEKGFIEMASHFQVQYIKTNVPARVRLYARTSDRDGDYGRPITYDPIPGLGIVMDYLTATGYLEAPLSPQPEGSTFGAEPNTPGSPLVPITVTSVDGGSVEVTLSYIHLE